VTWWVADVEPAKEGKRVEQSKVSRNGMRNFFFTYRRKHSIFVTLTRLCNDLCIRPLGRSFFFLILLFLRSFFFLVLCFLLYIYRINDLINWSARIIEIYFHSRWPPQHLSLWSAQIVRSSNILIVEGFGPINRRYLLNFG
jgi:hypothetical protein